LLLYGIFIPFVKIDNLNRRAVMRELITDAKPRRGGFAARKIRD
jgi:hypothetical protein